MKSRPRPGIDPRTAILVGGGGAAGLNSVAIARRLGSPHVVIPEVGAVLSAAGALMSDLTADYAATFRTTSTGFDLDEANRVLAGLHARCRTFMDGPGSGSISATVEFSVEARYPHQTWELEVPLTAERFAGPAIVESAVTTVVVDPGATAVRTPSGSLLIAPWGDRAR